MNERRNHENIVHRYDDRGINRVLSVDGSRIIHDHDDDPGADNDIAKINVVGMKNENPSKYHIPRAKGFLKCPVCKLDSLKKTKLHGGFSHFHCGRCKYVAIQKKNPTLQRVETRLTRFKIEDAVVGRKVSNSQQVAQIFKFMETLDREEYWVVHLNVRNRIIAAEQVAIGVVDAVLTHPRETLKAAIQVNASAFMIIHNHPSGEVDPSPEDINIVRRFRGAGELMGIQFLDSIIIGQDGHYKSLRDAGHWNN